MTKGKELLLHDSIEYNANSSVGRATVIDLLIDFSKLTHFGVGFARMR